MLLPKLKQISRRSDRDGPFGMLPSLNEMLEGEKIGRRGNPTQQTNHEVTAVKGGRRKGGYGKRRKGRRKEGRDAEE